MQWGNTGTIEEQFGLHLSKSDHCGGWIHKWVDPRVTPALLTRINNQYK